MYEKLEEYQEIENTALQDDIKISKPFDPTKINIINKQLSLDILIKRMESNRIDLKTKFQRKENLWNEGAQSRLIESILVRIPLPAFYFDGTDDNNWKVVDGLQRLSTLKRFVIDKNLKLSSLEYLKQYESKGYDDLPLYLQGRIDETQITAFIINPGTPKEATFNIFKRINTGGLMLAPQEIRHALNQGIPADFVKELAELPEFKRVVNIRNIERMQDRDLVTRFIGFYNLKKYGTDLDFYLNETMGNLAIISTEEREKIKNDFIKAMRAAYSIFEKEAFKKLSDKGRKGRFSKSLFDTWSVNLAKLSEDAIKILVSKKKEVREKFIYILENDAGLNNAMTVGTGKYSSVNVRIETIEGLIKEIFDAYRDYFKKF